MPDAVTFQVTTFHELARDEVGMTKLASVRLRLGSALEWILDELPEDAVTFSSDHAARTDTIVIDWSKVPDSILKPPLPARRR